MGKLIQKLVNGIVPSWLAKVNKSSATTSPKKLLPSSKEATTTHVSSTPPPSKRNNTDALPLAITSDNTQQRIADEEVAGTAIVMPKTHKNTANQPHQDQSEPHDQHHLDVKSCNDQNMPKHGANSCAAPSSRKQGTPSIHEDQHNQCMPEHNHHPQSDGHVCLQEDNQHSKKHSHMGLDEEVHVCLQEDNHHSDHICLDEEVHVCLQEDNHHSDHICLDEEVHVFLQEENQHSKKHSHEAEIGYEHYTNLYHDLVRLKRKSQDLQEEKKEEEKEGGRSGGRGDIIDMTGGWEWKRRKGERGLMSCELPESICRIVGNGKAVVKHSQDPHKALWESMVEMIVGNGIWEMGNLEFLLFCYLSLNEPHLHPIIQACFLQVLKDLEKTEF